MKKEEGFNNDFWVLEGGRNIDVLLEVDRISVLFIVGQS